jgi:hypothetical protein
MALISSLRSLALRVFPKVSRRNIKLCEKSFDKSFYRQVYPRSILLPHSPIRHYLTLGWRQGRDPSPWFSTRCYLARYEDVRRSGMNPLVHYLRFGCKEGRIAERSERADEITDPSAATALRTEGEATVGLEERSVRGPVDLRMLPRMPLAQQRQILIENGYFNEAYYRHIYPDIARNNVDPFAHYVYEGVREGRNPSPVFDTNYYRAMNLDLKARGNPLVHYAARGGPVSGRSIHPRLVGGPTLYQDVRSDEPRFLLRTDWDAGLDALQGMRLAVHIHCYYFDQLQEILDRLKSVPVRFELFLSVASADTAYMCRQVLDELGWSATISVVPNRGRDLGPLLVEYGQSLTAFDLVLHVHTKKSKHRDGDFGIQWGQDLLDKLLFNRSYVARVLQAFAEDKRLGVLGPTPFEQIRPFMVWGSNQDIARELMKTAVGDASAIGPICPPFPAGGMFWFRPVALKPLFDLKLAYSDFPEEPISDDGTIAHAIERCLFLVAQHNKWRTGYIEPLLREKVASRGAAIG